MVILDDKNILKNPMTQRENTETYILLKLLLYNQNQCNIVNKQCSLDIDVAFCINLDIPNILKFHHWYAIVLIISYYIHRWDK